MNRLLRAEGYVYDEKERRSHSTDEEGRIKKNEYNNKTQLVTVLYPWTQEKSDYGRKEASARVVDLEKAEFTMIFKADDFALSERLTIFGRVHAWIHPDDYMEDSALSDRLQIFG